jgi:hypothetical protein
MTVAGGPVMASAGTTDHMRNAVGFVPATSTQMRWSETESGEFDRWLAAHDMKVREKALLEAVHVASGIADGCRRLQDATATPGPRPASDRYAWRAGGAEAVERAIRELIRSTD